MEKDRIREVANGLDMSTWKHAFRYKGGGIRETQGS